MMKKWLHANMAWWELNEQRGRANNSAVLERDKITEKNLKTFG
jgi:hypothetical protein